jgi:hypothetical protein
VSKGLHYARRHSSRHPNNETRGVVSNPKPGSGGGLCGLWRAQWRPGGGLGLPLRCGSELFASDILPIHRLKTAAAQVLHRYRSHPTPPVHRGGAAAARGRGPGRAPRGSWTVYRTARVSRSRSPRAGLYPGYPGLPALHYSAEN